MTLLDPTPDETFRDRLRMTWPGWAIATGLLGWVLCVTNERGGRAILCYPFLALACAGVVGFAVRRFDRWWVRYAGAALAALVLVWWGSVDTYTERWHNGSAKLTDTYRRLGNRPIHRLIYFYDSSEESPLVPSAEGPLAGTGKPHGQWRYTTWEPEFSVRSKFYWYGEEVSEGEWHLRNK